MLCDIKQEHILCCKEQKSFMKCYVLILQKLLINLYIYILEYHIEIQINNNIKFRDIHIFHATDYLFIKFVG